MLKPILVSSPGRSGSTALMALLASDPRVAFERVYPFEHRYLKYFTHFAALLESGGAASGSPEDGILTVKESREATELQWDTPRSGGIDYLSALWTTFCEQTTARNPQAQFYAEKAGAWVAAVMRQRFDIHTIHLFRDPRDVFLSSNAFMRQRDYYSFGRVPTDTEIDYARTVVCQYLSRFESYYMERERTDVTLVRYEDFVENSESLSASLNEKLGVKVDARLMAPTPDHHRTLANLPETRHRWQREAFPPGVERLLVDHLQPEMAYLGYADPSAKAGFRSVEFAAGRVDLSRMEFSGDGNLQLKEDCALAKITGGDFWMTLDVAPFLASDVGAMAIALGPGVGDHCSLYWRNPDNGFSEERVLHVPIRRKYGWAVKRFSVAEHSEWKGTIAQLRLDLFNGVEAKGEGYVRWLRLIA